MVTAFNLETSNPNVVCVIQARLGSRRFPSKVLAPLRGEPAILFMLNRVRLAESIDKIVVAIPETAENDRLAAVLASSDVTIYRGSEDDVLSRYFEAAKITKADVVVRLTADCPLIDPAVIDRCVDRVVRGDTDYCVTSPDFPDGLDVEALTFTALSFAHENTVQKDMREHVTSLIRGMRSTHSALIVPDQPLCDVRITLDEPEDFEVISKVADLLPIEDVSHISIDNLARRSPEIFEANTGIARDEGKSMNSGQKLWKRAQKVIAGGNHLLSKRADMFPPVVWPVYYSRAKGCEVWDLDGNRFLDLGFMGIGTNILGYGNTAVDNAVRKAVADGNMSSLNPPEEVELAERLVELHPWSDMARFTRSGGEAGAVAVRLARAATGRDKVLFCGYHGWHDWYLAANLSENTALDNHLLPGLSSAGVPRGLRGTVIPFQFNDLESLKASIGSEPIAAIYMEVERSTPPDSVFLHGVRELATQIGAVLIFDECTSGFRRVLGGSHLHYGVNPDVVVLGKTLGNGYAINAVVGIEPVMREAWNTFISSTFWTERIGLVAALASIDEMEKTGAQAVINDLGLLMRKILSDAGSALGLRLSFAGVPALTSWSIEGVSNQELRTIWGSLMIDNGILGGNAFYASTAHHSYLGPDFVHVVEEGLSTIAKALGNNSLEKLAPNGLASAGFSRLVQ